MTTSSAIQPGSNAQRPGSASVLGIALLASATVVGLLMAAVTFFALAVAFPIAVPLAEQLNVPISASDMAIAEGFAAFWWVFAALAAASLVAAGVVVVKSVEVIDGRRRV
jgi:hypothetical protein